MFKLAHRAPSPRIISTPRSVTTDKVRHHHDDGGDYPGSTCARVIILCKTPATAGQRSCCRNRGALLEECPNRGKSTSPSRTTYRTNDLTDDENYDVAKHLRPRSQELPQPRGAAKLPQPRGASSAAACKSFCVSCNALQLTPDGVSHVCY